MVPEKRFQNQTKPQASRTPMPEALRRTIKLVNSIPVDREFPRWPGVYWLRDDEGNPVFPSQGTRFGTVKFDQALVTDLRKQLSHFPESEFPRFRQFVGKVTRRTVHKAIGKCEELSNARRLLREVAKISPSKDANRQA